jgi:hypothetical protein
MSLMTIFLYLYIYFSYINRKKSNYENIKLNNIYSIFIITEFFKSTIQMLL